MRGVPLTEGLGAGVRVVNFIASASSLNFKVVVPVRAATIEELPEARCRISQEEQQPPALVLLDMHALMATDSGEFLLGDGNDDMAKDDSSEGQRAGQPAATSLAKPIGDLQCAFGPLGPTAESQWHCGNH